jgi:Putative amidoligase enzyme.
MCSVFKRIIGQLCKTKAENDECKVETPKNVYEWENSDTEISYLYENVFDGIEDIYFGIEIEFQMPIKTIDGDYIVNVLKSNGIEINTEIIEGRDGTRKYDTWQLMKESTCDWEIISPILNDSSDCWKQLEKVCYILKNQLRANIDDNTAIHLHIQKKQLLNEGKHYISLMNLYRYLEPFTYAFSAGEESEVSLIRVKKYAATLKFADKNLWTKGMSQNEAKEEIRNGDCDLVTYYFFTRLLGLNFSTKNTNYRTVEFRTFNGTLSPTMIQSYLIYVINMINFAKQNDFEEEFLSGAIFEVNNDKKSLDKEYIDKCLSLLAKTEMQRNAFLQPLIRNNYAIPQGLYDALNGRYAKEEKNYFFV